MQDTAISSKDFPRALTGVAHLSIAPSACRLIVPEERVFREEIAHSNPVIVAREFGTTEKVLMAEQEQALREAEETKKREDRARRAQRTRNKAQNPNPEKQLSWHPRSDHIYMHLPGESIPHQTHDDRGGATANIYGHEQAHIDQGCGQNGYTQGGSSDRHALRGQRNDKQYPVQPNNMQPAVNQPQQYGIGREGSQSKLASSNDRAENHHYISLPYTDHLPQEKFHLYEQIPEVYQYYDEVPKDNREIQGHQNSCYLDSTIFGLFALSDIFDTMFLEPNQAITSVQSRKAASELLWEGIVNPLRK